MFSEKTSRKEIITMLFKVEREIVMSQNNSLIFIVENLLLLTSVAKKETVWGFVLYLF